MLRQECPHSLFRLVVHSVEPLSAEHARAIRSAFTVADQYWNRVNYFRGDPAGIFSCRLFQWVPADRWRAWLDALPADTTDGEVIQNEVYAVGKEHGFEPLRDWFKALYEVLFGVESGPRFGAFAAIFGVRETSDLLRRGVAGELLKA